MEWVLDPARCWCLCHTAPDETGIPTWPVDTADVCEAAAACDGCRDRHGPTVRPLLLANERPPEPSERPEPEEWIDG